MATASVSNSRFPRLFIWYPWEYNFVETQNLASLRYVWRYDKFGTHQRSVLETSLGPSPALVPFAIPIGKVFCFAEILSFSASQELFLRSPTFVSALRGEVESPIPRLTVSLLAFREIYKKLILNRFPAAEHYILCGVKTVQA